MSSSRSTPVPPLGQLPSDYQWSESSDGSRSEKGRKRNSSKSNHAVTSKSSPQVNSERRRISIPSDRENSQPEKSSPLTIRKLSDTDNILEILDSGFHLFVSDDNRSLPFTIEEVMNKGGDTSQDKATSLFEGHSALTIARQVTLMQHHLCCSVHPREFLLWMSSKQKEIDCPSLFQYVTHFNILASWIVGVIVTQLQRRKRKDYIVKCVEICRHFLQLNNFMGLQAVISALRHSAVSRMKKLFAEIPANVIKEFESIAELMSPFGNFSAYRSRLAGCPSPKIPYIGSDCYCVIGE
jgi:hypothetical protein